jgi:hypothetical protein
MKTEIVNREDITTEHFVEMLKTETHHDHAIIKDSFGRLRWKEDVQVGTTLEFISLNHLIPLLSFLGYGKNSEIYRKLYRSMGYSLDGYHEVFYWDVNNPNAADYKPNTL